MSAAGEKAGGGGRSGRKGGGRGGRSGSSAEQGAAVQEQMQTLTLNGGEAATARSKVAAMRTIDGIEILEAEPPAEAVPAAVDEPPSSTPSAASPTASQRESAEPEPSVQTRLGWALNRRGLMWVLIAARGTADTEEIWCRVRGHEPGSDELSIEVLTDCRAVPWKAGYSLTIGLACVREVLTRMDWLGLAEEMQGQHQRQYHRHSRDPTR